MDFMDYFAMLGLSLLSRSPAIIAWIIGVVLAARMLKRDGGKSERLLLIGCCLMLAQQIISPFMSVLTNWYIVENRGNLDAQGIGLFRSFTGIPLSIVCLVYAFWTRFRSHGQQNQDQVYQPVAE